MTFIDANVFMYAAGKQSPQLKPCQRFLNQVVSHSIQGTEKFCTNTEVLQEILHRYLSLGFRLLAFQMVENILGLGIEILPVTEEDIRLAKKLLEKYDSFSVRDAVHAGVMQRSSLAGIATFDKDFDVIPWIHRIEPK